MTYTQKQVNNHVNRKPAFMNVFVVSLTCFEPCSSFKFGSMMNERQTIKALCACHLETGLQCSTLSFLPDVNQGALRPQ